MSRTYCIELKPTGMETQRVNQLRMRFPWNKTYFKFWHQWTILSGLTEKEVKMVLDSIDRKNTIVKVYKEVRE